MGGERHCGNRDRAQNIVQGASYDPISSGSRGFPLPLLLPHSRRIVAPSAADASLANPWLPIGNDPDEGKSERPTAPDIDGALPGSIEGNPDSNPGTLQGLEESRVKDDELNARRTPHTRKGTKGSRSPPPTGGSREVHEEGPCSAVQMEGPRSQPAVHEPQGKPPLSGRRPGPPPQKDP